MEKRQYDELKDLQNKHWWFQGKKTIVDDFIRRYANCKKENIKALDIGCGMGLMLDTLSKYGTVFGCDMEKAAVSYCKNADFINPQNIREGYLPDQIPFSDSFDIIIALDVIEHVEDDIAAFKKMHQLLSINGKLFITVPAHMKMWSGNDELNHHYRRYEKEELEDKLHQTGFIIEKISFYDSFLLLPAKLVRQYKKRKNDKSSDVAFMKDNHFLNKILLSIFSSEKYFLRNHNFSDGVSLIAVVRK